MVSSLFRKRFLEESKNMDFGEVVLPPQAAAKIAAVVSISIITLLVGILYFLPYTRTETVRGSVVYDGDSYVMLSPFNGMANLDRVLIDEGDQVYPGTPIALLSTSNNAMSVTNDVAVNGLIVLASNATDGAADRDVATLISTQHGYLQSFLTAPGLGVETGQPIAAFNRKQDRIVVRALVSSRSVALLDIGHPIFVRLDSHPYQRFGSLSGNVVRIAESAANMRELGDNSLSRDQARFVVDVTIKGTLADGTKINLRPGTEAMIDFPLERGSFLEWIMSSLKKGRA